RRDGAAVAAKGAVHRRVIAGAGPHGFDRLAVDDLVDEVLLPARRRKHGVHRAESKGEDGGSPPEERRRHVARYELMRRCTPRNSTRLVPLAANPVKAFAGPVPSSTTAKPPRPALRVMSTAARSSSSVTAVSQGRPP